MNNIAVILARGNSKGLPNKNINMFLGKPLINWTVEQCLETDGISKLYVSSDSLDILDIVANDDRIVKIKRPNELALDSSSSEDVITHILQQIKTTVDYIIFPQVTSPLRESVDLERALFKIKHQKADSLFSTTTLEDLCVWDSNLKSITYDYKYRGNRQNRESLLLENGNFYIFKSEGFKKNNNRIYGKKTTYDLETWKSHEIDNIDDFELCEYFMEKKLNG